MRKFSAAEWEKDKTQRVVTRNGNTVRILATGESLDNGFSVVGIENGTAECWLEDGTYALDECALDLFFADPAPEPTDEESRHFVSTAFESEGFSFRVRNVRQVNDSHKAIARYALKQIAALKESK